MTFIGFAIVFTCVVLGAMALVALYFLALIVWAWCDAHFSLHLREEWSIVNERTECGFPARFRGISFWHDRLGRSRGIYYVKSLGEVARRKPLPPELDETEVASH